MPRPRKGKEMKNGNGATLGFEEMLWRAAAKMRGLTHRLESQFSEGRKLEEQIRKNLAGIH